MMIKVCAGEEIDSRLMKNYFHALVNSFFKILPIKEHGEKSVTVYLDSLMAEMLGCKGIIQALDFDASYMTLLSILQYLIENGDCPIKVVKREVFRAISICKKLEDKYSGGALSE